MLSVRWLLLSKWPILGQIKLQSGPDFMLIVFRSFKLCYTNVVWILSLSLSGLMPETVQIKENRLTVQKVDDTINTTFICEVRNSLGSGKDQVSIFVRGESVYIVFDYRFLTRFHRGEREVATDKQGGYSSGSLLALFLSVCVLFVTLFVLKITPHALSSLSLQLFLTLWWHILL